MNKSVKISEKHYKMLVEMAKGSGQSKKALVGEAIQAESDRDQLEEIAKLLARSRLRKIILECLSEHARNT